VILTSLTAIQMVCDVGLVVEVVLVFVRLDVSYDCLAVSTHQAAQPSIILLAPSTHVVRVFYEAGVSVRQFQHRLPYSTGTFYLAGVLEIEG